VFFFRTNGREKKKTGGGTKGKLLWDE